MIYLINLMTIAITILFIITLLLFTIICVINGISQICNSKRKANYHFINWFRIIRGALTLMLIIYAIIAYFYYIYNY